MRKIYRIFPPSTQVQQSFVFTPKFLRQTSNMSSATTNGDVSRLYPEARAQLAATFRFFHREKMDEHIMNHLSYVPDPSKPHQFLVQRFGVEWSKMTAEDIVLVDGSPEGDPITENQRDGEKWKEPIKVGDAVACASAWETACASAAELAAAQQKHVDGSPEFNSLSEKIDACFPPVEATALCIHGSLHTKLGPQRARCVLHCHSQYATVLSSVKVHGCDDFRSRIVVPIDQNTARWSGGRLGYDGGFAGTGLGKEAQRLADCFVDQPKALAVLLGQHGPMVVADSIGVAVDRLFYLERCCRQWVGALQMTVGEFLSSLRICWGVFAVSRNIFGRVVDVFTFCGGGV